MGYDINLTNLDKLIKKKLQGITRMEITIFDLIIGLIAIISLAFNFFQFYKEKINRKKIDDQRRLHETILLSLFNNMNEGSKSLEDLRRKGANESTISESIIRIINALRIEAGEFLKSYYEKEFNTESSSSKVLSQRKGKASGSTENLELIEEAESITMAMREVVERAERYIFCVGGQSREDPYLNALSQRVLKGDVRHIRVITGKNIKPSLYENMCKIFQHAELGYLKDDKYGGFLVTHDTVVSALYSSTVPTLEKALIIKDENTASDFRAYIQDLLNSSKKPLDKDFILSLCDDCSHEKQST